MSEELEIKDEVLDLKVTALQLLTGGAFLPGLQGTLLHGGPGGGQSDDVVQGVFLILPPLVLPFLFDGGKIVLQNPSHFLVVLSAQSGDTSYNP